MSKAPKLQSDNFVEEKRKLSLSLETAATENSRLSDINEHLSQKVCDLANKLSELRPISIKEKGDNVMTELVKEFDEYKNHHTTSNEEVQMLLIDLHKFANDNSQLLKLVAEMEKKNDFKQSEEAIVSVDLRSALEDLQQQVSEDEKITDELEIQNHNLTAENEKIRIVLEHLLNRTCGDSSSENKSVYDMLDNLSQEFENLKSMVTRLTAETEEYKKKILLQQHIIETKSSEHYYVNDNSIEHENEEINPKINQKHHLNRVTQDFEAKEQSKILDDSDLLKKSIQENKRLLLKLSERETQIESLSSQLCQQQESEAIKVFKAEQKIDQLERQYEIMHRRLSEAELDENNKVIIKNLNERNNELSEQNRLINGDYEELCKNYEQIQSERDSLGFNEKKPLKKKTEAICSDETQSTPSKENAMESLNSLSSQTLKEHLASSDDVGFKKNEKAKYLTPLSPTSDKQVSDYIEKSNSSSLETNNKLLDGAARMTWDINYAILLVNAKLQGEVLALTVERNELKDELSALLADMSERTAEMPAGKYGSLYLGLCNKFRADTLSAMDVLIEKCTTMMSSDRTHNIKVLPQLEAAYDELALQNNQLKLALAQHDRLLNILKPNFCEADVKLDELSDDFFNKEVFDRDVLAEIGAADDLLKHVLENEPEVDKISESSEPHIRWYFRLGSAQKKIILLLKTQLHILDTKLKNNLQTSRDEEYEAKEKERTLRENLEGRESEIANLNKKIKTLQEENKRVINSLVKVKSKLADYTRIIDTEKLSKGILEFPGPAVIQN